MLIPFFLLTNEGIQAQGCWKVPRLLSWGRREKGARPRRARYPPQLRLPDENHLCLLVSKHEVQHHLHAVHGAAWGKPNVVPLFAASPRINTLVPTKLTKSRSNHQPLRDAQGLGFSAVSPFSSFSLAHGIAFTGCDQALTTRLPNRALERQSASSQSVGLRGGSETAFIPSLPPASVTQFPWRGGTSFLSRPSKQGSRNCTTQPGSPGFQPPWTPRSPVKRAPVPPAAFVSPPAATWLLAAAAREALGASQNREQLPRPGCRPPPPPSLASRLSSRVGKLRPGVAVTPPTPLGRPEERTRVPRASERTAQGAGVCRPKVATSQPALATHLPADTPCRGPGSRAPTSGPPCAHPSPRAFAAPQLPGAGRPGPLPSASSTHRTSCAPTCAPQPLAGVPVRKP